MLTATDVRGAHACLGASCLAVAVDLRHLFSSPPLSFYDRQPGLSARDRTETECAAAETDK